MKEIQLTQGKVALVDDEDFEFLNRFKWSVNERNNNFYAVHSRKVNGKYKAMKMHRLIMGLLDYPKQMIDHKDGDGLNNQKGNLRLCTRSENARNTKSKKGSTSKYLGVSWKKSKRRWYVGVRVNNKHVYGGMFKDETEAAKSYNEMAKKYFGEFANLNKVA